MSKFLTPPVWYGSSGEKDRSLVNTKNGAAIGTDNTAFGYLAVAGNSNGNSFGAVAVGAQAQATNSCAIAIGSYDENGTNRNVSAAGVGSIAIGAGAMVEQTGGMAIGRGSKALEGGIAIGENASATANQIQLGDPSSRYDLKIGNNIGTINGINLFQAFASDGRTVLSASSANMIKSVKVDAGESASNIIITKLFGGIYVMAVRFLHASKGNIHSSFILVNTANPSGTIFFGSGCPFLGVPTPVCARYISQTPNSDGAKGKIDIVQISNGAFSTCPEATMESVCAFRIN